LSEDFWAQLGLFRAGSVVAGYRLEAQVGAGGSRAVVFRAHDQRLNRLVALKILAPSLTTDEAFRRRFIAESKAAARVDHPHIIPIYEAGETDGVLFIAMRFVQGGDLRKALKREGALPPDRVFPGHAGLRGAGADPGRGRGRAYRSVRAGVCGVPTAHRLEAVSPGRGNSKDVRAPARDAALRSLATA
jgi:hypothetical protein